MGRRKWPKTIYVWADSEGTLMCDDDSYVLPANPNLL